MAVFSVWSSLNQTLDDVLDSLYAFDMQISLDRSYRADHVVKEIERVPGVKTAESWNALSTRRVMPDGSEGEQFILFGVPPDTAMMEPPIKTGRWLLPDDENAIVLSTDVMNDNPDLKVGDTIVIKVGEREESWSLVGVMVTIQGMSNAYTPFEYFGRATHDVGKTQTLVVKTTRHERSFVAEVAENIENYLQRQSIDVSTTTLMQDSRETSKMFFAIVVGALLAMSLVIAAVGGLGLAGTMSLNVIERTREIGVMRAIGASNLMVLQVVMLEGIVLGILSWLLAALLSFPMSKLLIETVGEVLMGTSLSFAFSFTGLWTWLIGMLVLAIVSSFLPAWNASRVSVRQVLAHE
jgi:putative ABC transport system permease protein